MSTLIVENLQGPSSGSNANTITIPSGQVLNAPGHVLQVVQSVYSSQNATSSASWTNTSFTGTITPTKNTSKVLALCQIPFMSYNGSSNESIGYGRLYRDASNYSGYIVVNGYDYGGSGLIVNHTAALNWLDSPATTSATTYTFQMYHSQGTQTRLIYQDADAHMILMEIAG
jgi:hypothetical protein